MLKIRRRFAALAATAAAVALIAPAPGQAAKLKVGDVTAAESASEAKFKVTLTREVSHAVRARYKTLDESATADDDYEPVVGRLRIGAHKTRRSVTVPLIDDDAQEADETFVLRLSKPLGARIADAAGQATISDDDSPAPPVVINEIMADPSQVNDLAGEYVELYNAGTGTAGLTGWTLSDSGTAVCTLSGQLTSGQYFLAAASGNSTMNGQLPAPNAVCGPMSLTNGGDVLTLRDGPVASGTVVDVVDYTSSSFLPMPSGASLNLDPNAADAALNDTASNWCASTAAYGAGDLGTPKAGNSDCP